MRQKKKIKNLSFFCVGHFDFFFFSKKTFFLLHSYSNSSQINGYQGFFEILMITLISSKNLGVYKIMRNTVIAQSRVAKPDIALEPSELHTFLPDFKKNLSLRQFKQKPIIYLSVLDFWNLYFTKLIFELDFLSISNLIFTACVAWKNQVQTSGL